MKVLEDKNYIYVYVLQYKVISSQVLVLKILMTMKKSGKKKSGGLSPYTAVTLASSGSVSLENLLYIQKSASIEGGFQKCGISPVLLHQDLWDLWTSALAPTTPFINEIRNPLWI